MFIRLSRCRRALLYLVLICVLRGTSLAQNVAGRDGSQRSYRQTFAVNTAGLLFDTEERGSAGFVRKAVQREPYLELQFVDPVPRRNFAAKKIHVFCAEVGVYTPAPGGSTWTIGKQCHLIDSIATQPR